MHQNAVVGVGFWGFLAVSVLGVACGSFAPIGDSSSSSSGGASATGAGGAAAVCGNGSVEPGEACDDGNTKSDDGCSSTCKKESCGDKIVQLGLGEQCDDGNSKD